MFEGKSCSYGRSFTMIQADESLARTAGQVEAFCHLLRHRQGDRLRGWLEEVEQHGEPELQACARHLLHPRSLPSKQGSLWRGATGQRKAFSIASNC